MCSSVGDLIVRSFCCTFSQEKRVDVFEFLNAKLQNKGGCASIYVPEEYL